MQITLHNATSFVSFYFSKAHLPTHRHTHTHTYTHLLLYNHCPTRREQMPLQAQGEAGTLTVFVCNGADLAQTPFYNHKLVSVQVWGNVERVHSDFQHRGSWCKNMTTWSLNFCENRPWGRIQKKQKFYFLVNIHVLNELEWSGESHFSNAVPCSFFSPEKGRIVFLAISLTSSMQSGPISTNES